MEEHTPSIASLDANLTKQSPMYRGLKKSLISLGPIAKIRAAEGTTAGQPLSSKAYLVTQDSTCRPWKTRGQAIPSPRTQSESGVLREYGKL